MARRRLRILHVVPTYLPAVRYGGPIYSVHGLCKASAALGHDVHVATTNVDGRDDSDVPLETPVDLEGVKVWYFRSPLLRRLYYSPRLARMLKKWIQEFDIVHLHSVFLWPTWAAARIADRAGVPYVLSPRGMLDKQLVRRKSRWLKTFWIKLIERQNLERAELVHVTSNVEETGLRDFGFRLKSVARIPNGIDEPESYNDLAIGNDVRSLVAGGGYVLYLGRIHWKKGLDRLIDAWPKSSGQRLIIAGNDEEGYVAALRARADGGVSEDIDFIPRTVSGADKEALYANARLFVLPSYSENFGNTVLEAMARGVPVLVTPEVGAADVVERSDGGRVVAGRDLADGMRRMLSHDEEAAAMGRRGLEYVMKHCTWRAAAAQMSETYMSCIQDSYPAKHDA